jgi:hypothetical protein
MIQPRRRGEALEELFRMGVRFAEIAGLVASRGVDGDVMREHQVVELADPRQER